MKKLLWLLLVVTLSPMIMSCGKGSIGTGVVNQSGNLTVALNTNGPTHKNPMIIVTGLVYHLSGETVF